MKVSHRTLLLTVAVLVLVPFAAGCGEGGMSVADGKRAANEARQPVGKTYWKVRNSLIDKVYTTSGAGGFTECADKNAKDSLLYAIDEPLSGKSKRQTDEQFVEAVKNRLNSVGWRLKPVGNKIQSAEKNGIKVQLRLLDRSGDEALAVLVVQGECAKVGQAKGDIIGRYSGKAEDEYRSSPASPTPVPTTFPDPHAAS
ncbi:hypothetical protein OHN37_26670 [Streptomyces sp. NBC_00485]|uniref:hypothetical protein n=1 Tax=unclassified Streptomyces TaxID=2593676 RepID=UPI002E19F76B